MFLIILFLRMILRIIRFVMLNHISVSQEAISKKSTHKKYIAIVFLRLKILESSNKKLQKIKVNHGISAK